jgi:hypothetical protein
MWLKRLIVEVQTVERKNFEIFPWRRGLPRRLKLKGREIESRQGIGWGLLKKMSKFKLRIIYHSKI